MTENWKVKPFEPASFDASANGRATLIHDGLVELEQEMVVRGIEPEDIEANIMRGCVRYFIATASLHATDGDYEAARAELVATDSIPFEKTLALFTAVLEEQRDWSRAARAQRRNTGRAN